MNDVIIDNVTIANLIYEVRGVPVMIDSDLAKLYQCKSGTKAINQAVNRNLERFPQDFYFQLTLEEFTNLKSQTVTSSSKNNYGGVRKLPYVFTEQGVAMLATVLRTSIASQMSINIMRAFVAIRHYSAQYNHRLSNVETKIIEHDNNIKKLQESFNQFEERRKINEIYFNGQIYDAYSKIQDIFKEATKKLVIIDSYADTSILDIVKKLNLEVTIITKPNHLLTKQDVIRYNMQYHNLKVRYNNTFHDRYFIIDEKTVYHCGASINRIGYKTFSITLIGDDNICNMLITRVYEIMNNNDNS